MIPQQAWQCQHFPKSMELYMPDARMVMADGLLVVGGTFANIGGQNRNRIAALDAETGSALPWNPNANRTVSSIVASGTVVYVGGSFTSIGGKNRNGTAALDSATGNATDWNPYPLGPAYVSSIAVDSTTVYIAGNGLQAFDVVTGNSLAWNTNANNNVYSLAVNGTKVYAGGAFTSMEGRTCNHIAGLNVTAGEPLVWNPNAISGNPYSNSWISVSNRYIYSIVASRTMVYVGGNFDNIGQGVSHRYFAEFDSLYPDPVIRPISKSFGSNTSNLKITNLTASHFNSIAAVKFSYALPKPEHVSLRLYSLNGQMQSELVNKLQNAGQYSLDMQRGSLATGPYLVEFKAGEYHQEKMIFLMK